MFATQLNLYHNSQINEIHNAGGTDGNGLCVMSRMAGEKGWKTSTKKKTLKKNVKRHEKPNDDTHGLTNSSMNILNNFFPSFIFRFSVFGLFWQWENYDQTPYREQETEMLSNRSINFIESVILWWTFDGLGRLLLVHCVAVAFDFYDFIEIFHFYWLDS